MKMKKNYRSAAAMLTASMLCLSLIGCGPADPDPTETTVPDPTVASSVPTEPSETTVPPTSEPTEPAVTVPRDDGLDELRRQMEPSAAIAGVLYLGHAEEPYEPAMWLQLDQEYLTEYTFLGAIPEERILHAGGNDVYCIIPRDPASAVVVTEWIADTETAGKLLYESKSGEPFLVQCNVSDIMPNVSVTITDSFGEKSENYHPFLSLKDGSVSTYTDDGSLILNLSFPEGGTLHHFDLYLPSEDYQSVERCRQHIVNLDAEYLMQLLIENRLIPESVRFLGMEEDAPNLVLELNKAFEEHMNSLGEQEQKVFITCFVNSWMAVTDQQNIVISIEGQPLQTQYQVYDSPIAFTPVP